MGRFYVIFHEPLYLKTGCMSKRRAVIQIRNKPTFWARQKPICVKLPGTGQ